MNSFITYSVILIAAYLCSFLTTGAIRNIGGPKRAILTDSTTVVTTSGQLRGLHVVKSKSIEVFQYLGVPYAKPPIGKLRFQKPEELNNSKSLRDATELAPTCVQMRHLPQLINPLLNVDEEHKTSEDCLYLNIYVPKEALNTKKSLPVMVWLPGEGYDFADARQYDGSYLASLGNVIVVTVQYRVGVFGFLNADSIASGNMGLWDQIMALKWIKKNVAAFGGDPDNVTLFGRFTGSMSISILLTSPVLRDMRSPLFKRAILLSGIAVGQWVFEHNHQNKANQLLNAIGCNTGDKFQCLNNTSAENILEKASYGWRPTFDSDLIEEEPLKALEKGHFANGVTDVMLGTNEVEGSLCLLTHFVSKSRFYDKIINNDLTESDFLEMIENDMKMFLNEKNSSSYENSVFISSLINKNENSSLRTKYMEFCSSLFVTSHMKSFNKLLTKRQLTKQNDANITFTNTFMYELQYRPSFSIAPTFIESAIHGDDVLLAFGLIHNSPVISNKNDQKLTHLLIKSFSNFASGGNPNGENLSNHHWSNQDISFIKLEDDKKIFKDVVAVTQLFLFSRTGEVLLTFLTTSTTILALLATTLICFIIFALHKQRHSLLTKDQSLL